MTWLLVTPIRYEHSFEYSYTILSVPLFFFFNKLSLLFGCAVFVAVHRLSLTVGSGSSSGSGVRLLIAMGGSGSGSGSGVRALIAMGGSGSCSGSGVQALIVMASFIAEHRL